MSALGKLLCIKDSDWAYQDERRLLAFTKNKFNKLHIKSIYLGFAVLEENEKQIIERSKRLNFNVYKMKKPDKTNKISYTQIKI